MKFSTAKPGRIFIIRLEDKEILHEEIEKFAKEKKIRAASVQVVGGIDKGSILIVGPKESRAKNIVPMELILDDAHEVTGTGTIFPDSKSGPILHLHIACGRKDKTITGCVRRGAIVWHVLEVIIREFKDSTAKRLPDEETGFKLLMP